MKAHTVIVFVSALPYSPGSSSPRSGPQSHLPHHTATLYEITQSTQSISEFKWNPGNLSASFILNQSRELHSMWVISATALNSKSKVINFISTWGFHIMNKQWLLSSIYWLLDVHLCSSLWLERAARHSLNPLSSHTGSLLPLPCYNSIGGHQRPSGWASWFYKTLAQIQNHTE